MTIGSDISSPLVPNNVFIDSGLGKSARLGFDANGGSTFYIATDAANIVFSNDPTVGGFPGTRYFTFNLGLGSLITPHIITSKYVHYRTTGTPEGAETANVGAICARGDGGAGTSLYVKEAGTGATGWVAIGGGGGGGSGDVIGPESATDNALVRFDLTTGKLIQNSGATLDDAGTLTATAFAGDGSAITGVSSGTSWGDITGTLSDQTDLQTVLATKLTGTTDIGWVANGDAGDKNQSIPTAGLIASIATGLDILSAGSGTLLLQVAEKVKAIEAALATGSGVTPKIPNA